VGRVVHSPCPRRPVDDNPCDNSGMPAPSARFYSLGDVAEVLNISVKQVYALVRRGEIPAIKIGGRGQWRVEHTALDNYIEHAYQSTRQYIQDHPFTGDDVTGDLELAEERSFAVED
jgi:excisionase family DNA binding protein